MCHCPTQAACEGEQIPPLRPLVPRGLGRNDGGGIPEGRDVNNPGSVERSGTQPGVIHILPFRGFFNEELEISVSQICRSVNP